MTMDQTKEQEPVSTVSNPNKEPKHCFNCNNDGYTITQIDVPYTTEEGYTRWDHQQERVQCQCSDPKENSIHNFNKMITRLKGEHLE